MRRREQGLQGGVCHSELHRRATTPILDWSTLYVKDSKNDEDSNAEVTIIGPTLISRRMIDIYAACGIGVCLATALEINNLLLT